MAKSRVVKQPRVAHDSSEFAWVLSATQAQYLHTVRKLLVEYQSADGVEQRQVFIMMIHAFMQELCAYPPASYVVTVAASQDAEVGSSPHVVSASSSANPMLFYFTPSANPDDVHDLWVKHAQVYLIDPPHNDVAAACATQMVFTNFFLIDGARKDPKTGAWHLWSVSDLQAAQGTRIDLRILENETALAPTMYHVVQKRLQTLQYQHPLDGRELHAGGSEALAALTPPAPMEGHSA
jgi:hypothetical protein